MGDQIVKRRKDIRIGKIEKRGRVITTGDGVITVSGKLFVFYTYNVSSSLFYQFF